MTQNAKLSEKLECLSNRQNTWPSEIGKDYRERKPPLYTSEDIIRLNVLNVAEVQAINTDRVKMQKGLEKRIADCRVRIQGFQAELNVATETSRAKISLIDEELATYVRHPNAIPQVGHEKHPLMLHCQKRAATETIRAANTRINTDINAQNDEIAKCVEENGHVNLLKEVKHDRFWILKNDTHLMGHHPLTNSNEKIVATSLPSDQEIARLISTHPETKSINIPLTICSLIQYADVIGASDDSLLQMILIFLKKHSPVSVLNFPAENL